MKTSSLHRLLRMTKTTSHDAKRRLQRRKNRRIGLQSRPDLVLSGRVWRPVLQQLACLFALLLTATVSGQPLDHIRVSDDQSHFVRGESAERFIVWGVNYDHDHSGRLLDEYWLDEWPTVVEDFHELKDLGANCVRIHLQVGKFLDAPDRPNDAALTQLAKLVQLAEDTGVYLDITGLACYHKKNIPDWYDKLDEQGRWKAQAVFWEAVAATCKNSPAIFCYDLMNEPILPGKDPETDWLAGDLEGKFFVQRISLDLKDRTREQVAEEWSTRMVDAIRRHDPRHMVTVGEIPWIFVFGGGKPLFHSPTVGKHLDFVAVHFYPKKDEVDKALTALKAYDLGKPLVIEEMFPLSCSQEELAEFIHSSSDIADGWISFFWGKTAKQLKAAEKPTLGEAITAAWLEKFQELSNQLGTKRDDQVRVNIIEKEFQHLRSHEPREWSSFHAEAHAQRLDQGFEAKNNATPWTLSLRQQDVKQAWHVHLNGKSLGRLVQDENDLRTDFEIPADGIINGQNSLQIFQTGSDVSDDIRVGEIQLLKVSPKALRSEAKLEVSITDESGNPLPGRITIVDENGTLMPVRANSGDGLAVREGVVYTSTGNAIFGVAAGTYRVFAGHGFEYGIDQTDVSVMPGQHIRRTLKLKHEVDTTGWVACDTHVHTLTHSGHGDCTIEERVVTLAGEGIELPIATDHNKHIDYTEAATSGGVASRFTSVIGNEVTTKQGHFNVFPINNGSVFPDHTQNDWKPLFESIFTTPGVRIAILNHAEDIHSGFVPFSTRRHLSLTGESLENRPYGFNAMEVVNSGALQTDPMVLFADWYGLINRGLSVTPVGSSDSHDVSRYIVGQGRTYIACDDSNVAAIPIDKAVDNFIQGRVIVSYGLFTRLTVTQSGDGKTYGPGDQVPIRNHADEITVTIEVHGPAWTQAETVALYICGNRRFESKLTQPATAGSSLKGTVNWKIPRAELRHDVWLTALATGPGIAQPFWPTAKPYQPDSPDFAPYTLSFTGPVRIDIDGDDQYKSPHSYAQQIITAAGSNIPGIVDALKHVDVSVIHQAASILQAAAIDLDEVERAAAGTVLHSIQEYRTALRRSQMARLDQTE